MLDGGDVALGTVVRAAGTRCVVVVSRATPPRGGAELTVGRRVGTETERSDPPADGAWLTGRRDGMPSLVT